MWEYLLGFITALVLVFYILPKSWLLPSISSLITGPLELNKKPEVGKPLDSQKILQSTNTGSFQAFIYPLALQRTGQVALCSDVSNPQKGEPECSTGRYSICACNGGDCSPCAHTGYVNLINISNVVRVELLAQPDASRQNSASVQLIVRTIRKKDSSPDTETVEETLVLPNLELQKWTMLTVAREGRRFDVYYNTSLVLSKRTQYMPDVKASVSPIIAGDPLLNGKIAYVNVYPSRLTASEVTKNYRTYADTNGKPILTADMDLLGSLPICKSGKCLQDLQGPVVRPASPLLDWETDYA
jgi:hypothetical protein